jgi:hypothetical protein
VHLVVHQVVQLQHVHVAHRDRALEGFTGATVGQGGLRARGVEALGLGDALGVGQVQHRADFAFVRAVKDRRGEGDTLGQVGGHLDDFFVRQGVEVFVLAAAAVVHLVEELADLSHA